MNCPKCTYPNPQGVTYCQMCYEVFNRSAADRYLHAQRRAKLQRDGSLPPEPAPAPTPASPAEPQFAPGPRIVSETVSRIDWPALYKSVSAFIRAGVAHVLQHYRRELAMVAAIVTLGVLVVWYSSPQQRLQIFGGRLNFNFAPNTPVNYLIATHTEWKGWSERDGRLDTPLDSSQRDEMGTLQLSASRFIKLTNSELQDLTLEPHEWIVNLTGALSQNIPLNHPSVRPVHLAVNRRGQITTRDKEYSPRMGRAARMLFPRWAPRVRRSSETWDEPVEWVSVIGDWKIYWKGKMHWRFEGLDMHQGLPCLRVSYRADVSPALWDAPAWAKGNSKRIFFNGTTRGEVRFDQHRHQVLTNDFQQDGTLSIPIDNLYRIPLDQRVGRTPRRHREAQPGRLILQIKDKINAQKS